MTTVPASSRFGSNRFRFLAAALAVAALGVGCTQKKPVAAAAAPVPVTVARAEARDVPSLLQAIGAVQPVATVAVKALVSGQLLRVGFQQGDDVRAGQMLFQIDPQPFQAALTQAEATLARDRAVAQQQSLEAKRYAELFKEGIVSSEQNEQEQYSNDADLAATQADQAAVTTAQLNLSYCTIVSPLAGRTGSLLVQPGNLIQANTTVLVTVNQVSPIYVAFTVPEQYLLPLQRANLQHPLRVAASGQGDASDETGTVSFINNAIDTTTGTIQLMATFANQDRHLWPGEYVNTETTLGYADGAIVVPSTAVLTGQDDQYVYVVAPDDTVQSRSVVIGATSQGMTVIQRGLRAGETVVTDGQLALTPGTRVHIAGQSPSAAGPGGGGAAAGSAPVAGVRGK